MFEQFLKPNLNRIYLVDTIKHICVGVSNNQPTPSGSDRFCAYDIYNIDMIISCSFIGEPKKDRLRI